MSLRFHPEAEREYTEAIRHYLDIHVRLAEAFITEIEYGIDSIQRHPLTWRTVHADVRRYLIHRFPFGIYYTCNENDIVIWAVMHLSRRGDHWKPRLD